MRNLFRLRLIADETIIKKALFFFTALVVFFSFFVHPAFASLGFSPGDIRVEGVMANTTVEQTIYFSRDSANTPLTLDITFGGLAAEYISGPSSVTFETNQLSVPYTFKVSPGTIPEGEYTSMVSAVTRSANRGDKKGSGSSIALAAYPVIHFTVTNQAKPDFKIVNAIFSETEEHQPVGFSYLLENKGNVASRPSRIELKFVNADNPTEGYNELIDAEVIPFVQPFTNESVALFTKQQLSVGRYLIDIRFYGESGMIFERTAIPIQIFPSGTFQQKGTFEKFSSDKQTYEQNELIQFKGSFNNIGSIGVSASMVVEFFQGEKRIDLVKTDPVFVPPNRVTDFTLDKRFAEGGTYRAKGYINYGIYNTDSKDVTFTIGTTSNYVVIISLLGFVLVVFLALFFLLHSKRRKNSVTQPPQTPLPPGASVIITPPQTMQTPQTVQVTPDVPAATQVPPQPVNNLPNQPVNQPTNNSNNTLNN